MKTTMTNMNVQIGADELRNYSPVAETLSAEIKLPEPTIKGKVFSTADLWKLRKQRTRTGQVVR
jgi:hypothetical protein